MTHTSVPDWKVDMSHADKIAQLTQEVEEIQKLARGENGVTRIISSGKHIVMELVYPFKMQVMYPPQIDQAVKTVIADTKNAVKQIEVLHGDAKVFFKADPNKVNVGIGTMAGLPSKLVVFGPVVRFTPSDGTYDDVRNSVEGAGKRLGYTNIKAE